MVAYRVPPSGAGQREAEAADFRVEVMAGGPGNATGLAFKYQD